jgi:hypothetical protein
MVTWNDYRIQQERHNDLLRAAEQQRRVRAALAAGPRPAAAYDPLLAWLGTQLIAWGWRLRARYGALEHRRTRCACPERLRCM